MLVQLLISGFLISAIYALATTGFTLLYGVSGILNLAHGTTLVTAGMIAWYVVGATSGNPLVVVVLAVASGVSVGLLTYLAVVRPIQRMKGLSEADEHVFMLVGTLLWTIILQEILANVFGDVPVSVPQFVVGVIDVFGVRTPITSLLIAAVSWGILALLWLYVSFTKGGRALLAASINPRALVLCGFSLGAVNRTVWIIYGVLTGLAGLLVAMVHGVAPAAGLELTATAFSIVILGGLGSVPGSLIAANLIGYIETATAYFVGPSLRSLPSLIILVVVLYFRPQGLFGRR
jgi:branched-chain amino acid transport system permease protein